MFIKFYIIPHWATWTEWTHLRCVRLLLEGNDICDYLRFLFSSSDLSTVFYLVRLWMWCSDPWRRLAVIRWHIRIAGALHDRIAWNWTLRHQWTGCLHRWLHRHLHHARLLARITKRRLSRHLHHICLLARITKWWLGRHHARLIDWREYLLRLLLSLKIQLMIQ